MSSSIDINFDFRDDTPPGGDPDALSPTLREYHRRLWSKPLPLPFHGFQSSPLPASPDAYLEYKAAAMEFLRARNQRMERAL